MGNEKRVLVTGATGFIGLHVLNVLAARADMNVTACGRSNSALLPAGVSCIRCDMLDIEDVRRLCRTVRPTHILHLAWGLPVGEYRWSPLNVKWAMATANFAEIAAECGAVRFVGGGSCAEYSPSFLPCHEENTPSCPDTPYGRAKLAAARMLLSLADATGLSVAWGRIFYPFGKGEASHRLLPSALRAIREGKVFRTESAENIFDFTAVEDVAEMLVELLFTRHAGIVNLGSGEGTSVAEILQTLFEFGDCADLLQLENRHGQKVSLVADAGRRNLWLPGVKLSPWRNALHKYIQDDERR